MNGNGRNVIVARVKNGVTQAILRKRLKEEYSIGISPNKIVAIEKGDYSSLKYNEMIAISKILETPISELFFNE